MDKPQTIIRDMKMNKKTISTRFVKQSILQTFKDIKIKAEKNQVCKRKAVGAAILEINLNGVIIHYTAVNGPSGSENKCSNIKGACGCSHAEPRVIMKYLKERKKCDDPVKTILLTTYSACVNCSNIIIDSKVIDAVAYEILAKHWAVEPNNAKKMLDRSLPHWTKKQLKENTDNKILNNWLYK